MRQRRKLIKYTFLLQLYGLAEAGVPLARLIRDHELNISIPHLSKLINWCREAEEIQNEKVYASLNPDWLIENVQEVPNNYWYKGIFPYGEWRKK